VNIQLKNVNMVINTLNKDIKKINEKLDNLINNKNNYIIEEIVIKEEDITKDIRILNSYEESLK